MKEFITKLDPERWKVFQFLHIKGQNDIFMESFAITTKEFQIFKKKNEDVELRKGEKPIFESNQDMENSYFMLGPSGNVFTNSGKIYTEIPFSSVNSRNIRRILNSGKYISRGGLYNWK
jgi:radical S-adenosyl methionine domain-containing protein 2